MMEKRLKEKRQQEEKIEQKQMDEFANLLFSRRNAQL
jgi:flagellar FliJ protein